MALCAQMFDTKPDDLSSISGAHIVNGGKQFPQVFLTSTCMPWAFVHACTHNKLISVFKKVSPRLLCVVLRL